MGLPGHGHDVETSDSDVSVAELFQGQNRVVVGVHEPVGVLNGEVADRISSGLLVRVPGELFEKGLVAAWHVTSHPSHESAVGGCG